MLYRGFTLDRFQEEAIRHIEDGKSVIVSAPTGTGKTVIADYLIEQILKDGGEVIYTSPIKALSNQKYRQYGRLFGKDAIGLVTGDLVINRDAPIRIMTTEILRNILLEGREAPLEAPEEGAIASPADVTLPDLARLKAVILDEIHFLADPDRGTVWEELLIYLPRDVRILGLSATLSNLEEFADWLSAIRDTRVEVVYEPKRSVPLKFFMANKQTGLVSVQQYNNLYTQWTRDKRASRGRGEGGGKKESGWNKRRGRDGGGEGRTRHLDMLALMPPEAFPALYFIFSRALVEQLAHELAREKRGRFAPSKEQLVKIEAKLAEFDEQTPGVLTQKLRHMYEAGIGFHHAGLHVALKSLVEELYENSLLGVLYCTSTFALGINMPARTVIFDALTRYDGKEVSPMSVREFMQMAGRAGRRGLDVEGDVMIRQDFSDYEEIRQEARTYFENKSEPVLSAFNLSFHTIVNLLRRFDDHQIRDMLTRSFKAYQSQQHADALRAEIARREEMLRRGDLPDTGDRAERQLKQEERIKRHKRALILLQRELLEEERPRLWEAFQQRVEFLRAYGYISEHNELQNPAKILQYMKIEEILMTELIMSGALENLSPEELFGVMCGFVQTLPRAARVHRPDRKWRAITDPIYDIVQSDVVRQAAELTGAEVIFTPEIMPLGERWAKGESLALIMREIENPTDLSGDMVGSFRRAKDLIGQLRNVYAADPDRRKLFGAILRQVTRDEVEVID
jgi:ATP-dependent RNA helicase HelY